MTPIPSPVTPSFFPARHQLAEISIFTRFFARFPRDQLSLIVTHYEDESSAFRQHLHFCLILTNQLGVRKKPKTRAKLESLGGRNCWFLAPLKISPDAIERIFFALDSTRGRREGWEAKAETKEWNGIKISRIHDFAFLPRAHYRQTFVVSWQSATKQSVL